MFQHHKDQFAAANPAATGLSEILGAFSFALDLTEGQPAGHSVRACWIGTQVAAAIGMTGQALRDVYYAVLLKDLGCSSNAARVSELFVGDDRALKHGFKLIGPSAEDFGAFIMAEVGADADAAVRDAALGHLAREAGPIMVELMETRCTRGADIARRLRFSEDVATAIAHLDEHWDGSGLPIGLAGDAIHIGGRIALLAQVADVFFMARGPAAAVAEIERRSGAWIDPALARIFATLAKDPGFWSTLAAPDLETRLFALEPAALRVHVDADYLDDIAAAFGQVIDAKSPFTGGHSDRVGLFSAMLGQQLGLPAAQCRVLRRAALLHDIGKLGVSSRILEKPGKLDADEWAAMQSHAELTTAVLSRVGVLRDMAMIAGSHHERLDGRGYPLQLDARMICLETRIITVADFFDALTADRPYRRAMPVDRALAIMAADVGSAIDPDCFAALGVMVSGGIPAAPLPDVSLLHSSVMT
jgi:HD-GYP domain-containing protein (c-di-GMP phosphodiesterase class II)